MLHETQTTTPTKYTVKQYAQKEPAFTENSLRAFIFNSQKNGLDKFKAVSRVGRKVLIDHANFQAWIEAQNQGGVK
jgi:hypothetical protein